MLDNDPEHSVGTALCVRLIDQGLSSLQRRLCTRVLLGDQTFIFSLNDTRKGTHCKKIGCVKGELLPNSFVGIAPHFTKATYTI